MMTGKSRVRSSWWMRCSTSTPSTFGSFRSSSTSSGSRCSPRPAQRAGSEQVVERFDAVAGHHHLVAMLFFFKARKARASSPGLSSTRRMMRLSVQEMSM